MTDSGPVRPRRAMGPPPPDDGELSPPTLRGGARALPFDPEWRPGDEDTQLLRRVILPDTPDNPASPASPPERVRAWSPTPVPPPVAGPPRPVLPSATASLQASAGRRFSASASPSEFRGVAPRRSATSVSSPPSPYFEPIPRPAVEFVAPAPVVAPESIVAPADDAKPARKRRRGLLIGVLAIVVALALGVAATFLWFSPRDQSPTTPITPTPSASLDPLITPADLVSLGGSAWSIAAPEPTGGDGLPLCLPAPAATMPTPDRTVQRTLVSGTTATETVIHVVDTYADAAAATRAYAARLQQAGTCSNTTALILSTRTVAGLADAAFGIRIDVQNDPVEHHGLVISRTGRNLSMVDVRSAKGVDLELVATAAAEPSARMCSGGEGACPTTVTQTAIVPPPGEYPGWLIEADLPRITPGAGRWGPTPPSPTLSITGSQCEAVGLVEVPDTTASAQRTLLLADDPVVPFGFGVDQVVYTFEADKPAKAFADKVASNLGSCAERLPTASVDAGPTVKGTGAGGAAFSGKSYFVTQKTANDEVQYRVAVVRVGDRVAYLLANPSAEVDFSDAQWKAIMTRTGQRVSQMP